MDLSSCGFLLNNFFSNFTFLKPREFFMLFSFFTWLKKNYLPDSLASFSLLKKKKKKRGKAMILFYLLCKICSPRIKSACRINYLCLCQCQCQQVSKHKLCFLPLLSLTWAVSHVLTNKFQMSRVKCLL